MAYENGRKINRYAAKRIKKARRTKALRHAYGLSTLDSKGQPKYDGKWWQGDGRHRYSFEAFAKRYARRLVRRNPEITQKSVAKKYIDRDMHTKYR